MSKRLKDVMERAETWPEEVQEEAAEALLSIEQGFVDGYVLTAEDREALAKSADDVRQERFVNNNSIVEFFERYRHA